MKKKATSKLGNLGALKYFVDIAAAGSFRAASQRLHVAASALNRHIGLLEEEYGARLFERSRGRAGLTLTPAGQILHDHSLRAVAALEQARSEISAVGDGGAGHIRLGVNEGLADTLLPRLLGDFSRHYPRVTYDVHFDTSARLMDLLAKGGIDMVLAANAPAAAIVEIQASMDINLLVAMSRSHPLASMSEVTPTDIANEYILLPSSDLALRGYVDDRFACAGLTPRLILTSNSLSFLRRTSAIGVGVAIVNAHVRDLPRNHDDTAFIPLKTDRPQRVIFATRARHTLPPHADALKRQLIDTLFYGLVSDDAPPV